MRITFRPLTLADVEDHNAGEDDETVRWLNGVPATAESTRRWFEQLADNARTGHGAQGFGVLLDGRLAGYTECNPHVRDGLVRGDVNISYAVHPWARRRGVAVEIVRLMCEHIREHRIGTRAAIRVQPANVASVRVAERCGFVHVRDFFSRYDKVTFGLYLLEL